MPPDPQAEGSENTVPLAWVTAFARQLAHDLNNDLNSLDLAATYIAEIIEDPSAREELATQRETIRSISNTLKTVSRQLQPPVPAPITIAADDFIAEIRTRFPKYVPAEPVIVSWIVEAGASQIKVDFEMACEAFIEVLKNAFLYRDAGGKIEFRAAVNNGKLHVEITEEIACPPPSAERLGRTPFISVNRRAYGLGLFYASQVAVAHGGTLTSRHDSSRGEFIVEIVLPVYES